MYLNLFSVGLISTIIKSAFLTEPQEKEAGNAILRCLPLWWNRLTHHRYSVIWLRNAFVLLPWWFWVFSRRLLIAQPAVIISESMADSFYFERKCSWFRCASGWNPVFHDNGISVTVSDQNVPLWFVPLLLYSPPGAPELLWRT